MISSVVSDRTIVIAPSLRHVQALNSLLGELLPSEVVKFEAGDDWTQQPDDKIIYVQLEHPLVAVGKSTFTTSVDVEQFFSIADLRSAKQSFSIDENNCFAFIDPDGYRYGNKELGITSIQNLAKVFEHLAQKEG